jgi:hypothetical protein
MYYIDANKLMNGVLLALLGVAALLFVATILGAWLGKRGRVMSYPTCSPRSSAPSPPSS